MFESLREKMKLGGNAGLFGHPAVAGVVRKATHLRADLLDQLDGRLSGVAKKLNLATRAELKALKRQIRELENQVENLERQLVGERKRADEAETALGEAAKAAKKAGQTAQVAQKEAAELAQKKAELEAQSADLAAREKTLSERIAATERLEADFAAQKEAADKPASRKSPLAKKKAEDNAEPEAEEPSEG
jgi:chromosome segregation ATPase